MSVERYTATAISLHWLMFLLILGSFGLGFYMVDLPLSPAKLKYYSWHKWVGVTVFLLVLVRLSWRMVRAAPPLPSSTPAWQARAAHASHALLYLLMVVTPLSGWIYSSAAGLPTVYFGILQLPDLVTRDRALAEQLKSVHIALNSGLGVLVLLHAAAALKHQFIDKDGLMSRMWPGRRTGKEFA
jgi:cytochrome b561